MRVWYVERVGQLAFSTLMVIGDRHRYKHPRLQWALLGAMTGESAWVAYRITKAGAFQDRTAVIVDASCAASALVVSQFGLGPSDAATWMKNLAIGAAHGASSCDDTAARVGAVTMLGAAGLWCGTRARGRDARVSGWVLAVNDVITWVGQHCGARAYVNAHRRHAVLADTAGVIALEHARAVASQAERTRQHRRLHSATLSVFGAMSSSADREQCARMARAEANRLRCALVGRDSVGSDLFSTLHRGVEAADAIGVRVELVFEDQPLRFFEGGVVESETQFHNDLVPPSLSASLGGIIREIVSLLVAAAQEFGATDRLVLRVVPADSNVALHARFHGKGFDSSSGDDGSEYARALEHIVSVARVVDGDGEFWSQPERGARISVSLPAVPTSGIRVHDQFTNPRPDGLIGSLPTFDDDIADANRDLLGNRERRFGRTVATQSQFSIDAIIDDLDARAGGQALQTGAQQRTVRRNVHADWFGHAKTMTQRLGRVVGKNASIGKRSTGTERKVADLRTARPNLSLGVNPASDASAGRAIATALLAYRVSGIATGLAAVVAGRRNFRRAGVAVLEFVGISVPAAVIARRLWQRAGDDVVGSRADALIAIAAVIVGRRNVNPADRSTYLNWAPWGLAAPSVSGQAMTSTDVSSATVLSAVGVAGIASAALSEGPSEFATNMVAMAGMFVGGRVIALQIRDGSQRLAIAQGEALHEGAMLARERERSRQLRALHDSALQTLEAIGGGHVRDLEAIQLVAVQETVRLEQILGGSDASLPGESLCRALRRIVAAHAGVEMKIEFDVSESVEKTSSTLKPEVVSAIAEACHEAVTNVAKHANVRRAKLTVNASDSDVSVCLIDRGIGFDSSQPQGFGLTESIRKRISEIGGEVEIISAPGKGTRVSIWVSQ